MINLLNYEEFFFRYAEGDLSKAEREEVLHFLKEHPELRPELDAFHSAILNADENVRFPEKNKLKQAEVDYDHLFIRHIENDLSAEEVSEVHRLTANDAKLATAFKAYKSTIFSADENVIFPDKNSLKHAPRRVVPMYAQYLLVAAVAAVLFFVIFIKGIRHENNSIPVAQQNSSSNSNGKSSEQFHSNPQQEQSLATLSSANTNESVASSDKNEAVNHSSVKTESSNAKKLFAGVADKKNDAPVINAEEDMMQLDHADSYISYQPRTKKASYVHFTSAEGKTKTENRSSTDIKTMALGFGKDLLRLSGREDLLGSSNAFNSAKKKEPVVFSIRGSKFDFYHKFFKKRNKQSSDNH